MAKRKQPPAQPISETVMDELRTHLLQVHSRISANRLWAEMTDGERDSLGGNLLRAYNQGGTIGMWMRLRRVSQPRAIIELAYRLGFISKQRRDRLVCDIHENPSDVEEAVKQAIKSGDLVLVEDDRTVFWKGRKVRIDWHQHSALWSFFMKLCQQAKVGRGVDQLLFSRDFNPNYVTKITSRLCRMAAFPKKLAGLIIPAGLNTKRLDLPPGQIHVFRLETIEILKEEIPAPPKDLTIPLGG